MASNVVLAIFPDEAAADGAVESLKAWDKIDDDIKLNAVGVLVLDDKGKVKTQRDYRAFLEAIASGRIPADPLTTEGSSR